jgi:hypothetical protein
VNVEKVLAWIDLFTDLQLDDWQKESLHRLFELDASKKPAVVLCGKSPSIDRAHIRCEIPEVAPHEWHQDGTVSWRGSSTKGTLEFHYD